MSDDDDDSGFMTFAQGWNQTVKGWYHDAAGNAEQLYGYITDDETTMIEGAIHEAEGEAQAERGYNLMGSGISEMLGLVDHGDGAGSGGGWGDGSGGAGGAPSWSDDGAEGAPGYDDSSGGY